MNSSQRLLIIVFALNFLIGALGSVATDPTTLDLSFFEEGTDNFQAAEGSYYSEEGIWGSVKATASRIYENTLGNVIQMGKVLFSIFLDGVNPWSIGPNDFDLMLEKLVAWALLLFRSVLMGIVMLEGYFILKNKKVT